MVVGSGIGGMESAIKLGDMGYKVLVVEKEASVGGKMILLSKVFPTLDCASCISTPKMASTIHHPNITALTYSEVKGITPGRRWPLPCHGPAQGTLRRRGRLHRLPAVRGRLHGGGARPVQRRPGRAARRLHPVPAGGAQEGGHRAHRLVALLLRLPGGHPGARLRLAHPGRRLREGIPAGAGDDAAGGNAGTCLLRALRGRLHAQRPRRDAAHPAAQALRRRLALRARTMVRASRSRRPTARRSPSWAPVRPA